MAVPRLLSTTITADLDHNHINILHNDSFAAAQYTQVISLQHNGLLHIEEGALSSLSHLRVLRLAHNHLASLPGHLFDHNPSLQELDLSHNAFLDLPDTAMYQLGSLHQLNVSWNALTTSVLGSGFQATTQLVTLDLTGNHLVSLDAAVFRSASTWDSETPHYLNLSSCGLRHLHEQALSTLPPLAALSLSGNPELPGQEVLAALQHLDVTSLQTLHLAHMNLSNTEDFFMRFDYRALTRLDLSHNLLPSLSPRSFYYLETLRLLDLSHNLLAEVPDLSGLNQLQQLHLAHNAIDSLEPHAFEALAALQVLDLSHNCLAAVSEAPFETFWDLHTLDLRSNQLRQFSLLTGLESLETLLLADNLLADLGMIARLHNLRTLDLSHNLITSLPPTLFARGQELEVANFSRNIITSVHPSAFSASSPSILDLSLNKLWKLQHYGWRSITQLHLQGNLISNVTRTALAGLTSLTQLNLADNSIHTLPRTVFTDVLNLRQLNLNFNPVGKFLATNKGIKVMSALWKLEKLKLCSVGLQDLSVAMLSNLSALEELHLDGNHLTEHNLTVLTRLQKLNALYLAHNDIQLPQPRLFQLPRLHRLSLAGNPFHCTCRLMPFRNWLLATNVSLDGLHQSGAYQCQSPPEWQGLSLQQFQLQSDTCSPHERVVLIATIACSGLAVAMCVALILYRYRSRHKHHRTHYSAIDETTAVHIPRVSTDSRDWVWQKMSHGEPY